MKKRISALQVGSRAEGTQATLQAIIAYESTIAEAETDLVVMPEALLGGYPKGEIFGTRLGYRLPEGRERFRQYFDVIGHYARPDVFSLHVDESEKRPVTYSK